MFLYENMCYNRQTAHKDVSVHTKDDLYKDNRVSIRDGLNTGSKVY